MTLRNLPKHHVPQFPHLYNGDDNNPQWIIVRIKWVKICEGLRTVWAYNQHRITLIVSIIFCTIIICGARGFWVQAGGCKDLDQLLSKIGEGTKNMKEC